MKNGLHIIADLSGCNLHNFCQSRQDIKITKSLISKLIKKNYLKEVGSYYHFFSPDAVTAAIALAESHITFHTWPESSYVSCDIFVCNYSRNNEKNAHNLFNSLANNVFKAKKIKVKVINR